MALRVGSQPLPQTTAISQATAPAAPAIPTAPAAPKGLEGPMKLLDQNIAQLKANHGATGGTDAFSGAPGVLPTLSAPPHTTEIAPFEPLPVRPPVDFLKPVGKGGDDDRLVLENDGGGSKTGISGGTGGRA